MQPDLHIVTLNAIMNAGCLPVELALRKEVMDLRELNYLPGTFYFRAVPGLQFVQYT
jgi:hypothetical protein